MAAQRGVTFLTNKNDKNITTVELYNVPNSEERAIHAAALNLRRANLSNTAHRRRPPHTAEEAHSRGVAAAIEADVPNYLDKQKAIERILIRKAPDIVSNNVNFVDVRYDTGITPPRTGSGTGPIRSKTPAAILIYADGTEKRVKIPVSIEEIEAELEHVYENDRQKATNVYEANVAAVKAAAGAVAGGRRHYTTRRRRRVSRRRSPP